MTNMFPFDLKMSKIYKQAKNMYSNYSSNVLRMRLIIRILYSPIIKNHNETSCKIFDI
jgi:hypothetical protein